MAVYDPVAFGAGRTVGADNAVSFDTDRGYPIDG